MEKWTQKWAPWMFAVNSTFPFLVYFYVAPVDTTRQIRCYFLKLSCSSWQPQNSWSFWFWASQEASSICCSEAECAYVCVSVGMHGHCWSAVPVLQDVPCPRTPVWVIAIILIRYWTETQPSLRTVRKSREPGHQRGLELTSDQLSLSALSTEWTLSSFIRWPSLVILSIANQVSSGGYF